MLSELLDLIEDNTISGKIAKEVLDIMIETQKNATQIVEEKGLKQTTDMSEINKIIEEVINNNQKQVEQYNSGNDRIFHQVCARRRDFHSHRQTHTAAGDGLRGWGSRSRTGNNPSVRTVRSPPVGPGPWHI